ncbi:MAG TPA: dihydrolipoamide acetyltransferase family protein, partial [Negativicutes bacterium]|nr:dihydrolipoamide acetyltransferase family protein [Negativicutes bacterium]
MAIQVVMPQLGITTLEGTITSWLKGEGDAVSKGEPLFEIATDKVNMVVESLGEGILRKIIVPAGGTAKVTETVAIIAAADEDIASLLPAAAPDPAAPAPAAPAAQPVAAAPASAPEPSRPAGRAKISPLARRIAQAEGLSLEKLAAVAGSGIEGAVVKADVLKYAAEQKSKEQAASVSRQPVAVEPNDNIVPLTPMRKTIAERMSMSTREAPQFWLGTEARLNAVVEWRKTLNERLAGKGANLTYTDFFIKATAMALRDCPYMNTSYSPEGIIFKAGCHIGVAVAIDEGLIVPVIRNADKLSLGEIAEARTRLIEKAKSGRLSLEEFSGGTFTISNLGMFGVDQFVAIVNPPEAAILSVGRISEVLELRDGNVVSVPKV